MSFTPSTFETVFQKKLKNFFWKKNITWPKNDVIKILKENKVRDSVKAVPPFDSSRWVVFENEVTFYLDQLQSREIGFLVMPI